MTLRTSLLFLVVLVFASSCSHSTVNRNRVKQEKQDRELAYAMEMAKGPKIVIDAGHGGKDLGALSHTNPKYQEKNLNLATALLLNNFLQHMGYQTILTRGDDYFVPLSLRTSFANSNHALLFVSVHYNAAPNTKAEGVEVYYYNSEEDKERSEQSKKLAQTVLDQITFNTECKSRGVKHGNLAVIRETKMPAILIEGGFVTNDGEIQKLSDPAYLKTIAGSIALGLQKYLKTGG